MPAAGAATAAVRGASRRRPTPRIKPDCNAFQRPCDESRAQPDHPNSSPGVPARKATNISSAGTTCISIGMGRYRRWSVMRLTSMDRFSRPRTTGMPLALPTSSRAAAIGQKAIRKLTDRPGIN